MFSFRYDDDDDMTASEKEQYAPIACATTSKKQARMAVDLDSVDSDRGYNSDFSARVSEQEQEEQEQDRSSPWPCPTECLKAHCVESIVEKSLEKSVDNACRPAFAAMDIVHPPVVAGSVLKTALQRDLDPEESADERSLRNSVAKDHLLDYLNKFGADQGYVRDSSVPGYDPEFEFNLFVSKKQNEFKMSFVNECCRRLNEAFPMGFCSVWDEKIKFSAPAVEMPFTMREQIFNIEIAQKTILSMMHGVPLIVRPILHNHEKKICHAPDMLVRSDMLVYLFDHLHSAHLPDLVQSAPNLLGNHFHYVIVNIRFSDLHLKAGAEADYVENNGSMKFYKIQAFAQNSTLDLIQGYLPQEAYIAGHSWSVTKPRAKKRASAE